MAPLAGSYREDVLESVGSSPGRVTLLGEHTDYNAGTSLAMATSQRTVVHAVPWASGRVEVRSSVLGAAMVEMAAPVGPPFAILATHLARAAGVAGLRLVVDGDLPVGAGLSSSAAYAVAVARSLGIGGDALQVARRCQAAELAAGSDVGLLDQLVALVARARHAVHLDFAALDDPDAVRHLAIPDAVALSVVDTGVRRAVADSAYAERRAECAAAAAAVGPLGRATVDDLAGVPDLLLRRRARHVVTECARVAAATDALAAGDLTGFGQLLDEGHASLRDDFEASAPAVESVRDAVRAMPGVVGVRLCGAGFGGSLVVAHQPGSVVTVANRWSTPLEGGPGATGWSR